VLQVLFDLNVSKIYGRAISVQAWTSPEFSGGVEIPRFPHSCHMRRLPLPPQQIFLVLISVRGWVDPWIVMRPGGLSRWQIWTPLGIEPATFWLVTQSLNQVYHCVPQVKVIVDWYWLYCSYCKCPTPHVWWNIWSREVNVYTCLWCISCQWCAEGYQIDVTYWKTSCMLSLLYMWTKQN